MAVILDFFSSALINVIIIDLFVSFSFLFFFILLSLVLLCVRTNSDWGA